MDRYEHRPTRWTWNEGRHPRRARAPRAAQKSVPWALSHPGGSPGGRRLSIAKGPANGVHKRAYQIVHDGTFIGGDKDLHRHPGAQLNPLG